MSGAPAWIGALRRSHDRLAALVAELDDGDAARRSGCDQWTVAQVLSHLGSQAEIFSLVADSALSGGTAPGPGQFGPIWDAWNARTPGEQVARSISADDALVSRFEGLGADQLAAFRLGLFGAERDAIGILRMRLSEHALHTWDVAVAFDSSAQVAADAVELLVDGLGDTAGRAGRAPERPIRAAVTTSAPERRFTLTTDDGVRLEPGGDEGSTPSIEMPAEALLRLVYGRLGGEHPARGPVREAGVSLAELVPVFPGF